MTPVVHFRRFVLAAAGVLAGFAVSGAHSSTSPVKAAALPATVERERTLDLADGSVVTYHAIIDPAQTDPDQVMDTLFPGSSDPTTPTGGASANSTVYAVWAPSQIPLPILYSGDNAPAALAGAAGQAVFAWAVAEWNGIGSGMTLIPGAGDAGSSVCDARGVADGVNTIEWRASLPDGVLGTTCAVSDGGTILGYPHYIEADIVFSAAIPWSADDVTPADTYDWETTLLHEMGHLVGLSHTETADAVMFASLDKGVQRRSPQPDDIAGVRALYGLGVVTQANGVELPARAANMVKRAITLSVASSP